MRSVSRPLLLPLLALLACLLLPGQRAAAQDQVWIQIEARPSLAEATERAEAYGTAFPETHGFRLPSGWYGIALGPYGVEAGAAALNTLRRENLIPSDSYITDGREYREAFWPAAGSPPASGDDPAADVAAALAGSAETAPAVDAPAAEPVVIAEPAFVDETPAEARASEAALSSDEKKLLQTALGWFGFYEGSIDGAYGPGTRKSMAAWQSAFGLEPTGVLTAHQRATLNANYAAEVAEFGFAPIEEQEAGINVTLPLSLVEFDRYEPPFVHYRGKNGADLSLVLISQPGDPGAFAGLYDILQSLDAMPPTGERDRNDREFSIHGVSATHDSHAYARYDNGFIKGWMLLSTPAYAERDARILQVIGQSFRPVGETALDPGLVPLDEAARRGLLAGLEVKRAKLSASGFYVGDKGEVLTAAATVAQCAKVTLDGLTEASVKASADGMALLVPARPLSPPAVAGFPANAPRRGAEIVVAGYSYGERLPSAVLTWGVLEDLAGLNGETGVLRLAVPALAGDAGGAVLDGAGAVIGMLSPGQTAAGAARQLPEGTFYASDAASISAFLSAQGINAKPATGTTPLPPETLTTTAAGMTALVSCWD